MEKTIETMNYKDGSKGIFEKLNEKHHGLWTILYPSGQKKWERQHYKARTHGFDRKWNNLGQLTEEQNFWRNNLDGTSRKWFDNGVLKQEGSWKMGRCLYMKNWDENGILIEEYRQPIIIQEESETYQLLSKHEKFDPDYSRDGDQMIKTLEKKVLIIKKTKVDNSQYTEACLAQSIMGDVNVCAEGEEWPIYQGTPLSPVLQLYTKGLPFTPDFLEDIKCITVFIHPEGHIYDEPDSLCIRWYTQENLVQIQRPADIMCSPSSIRYDLGLDVPSDDMPDGLSEYLEETYADEEWQTYDCKMGSKLFGWPKWIQCSEFSSEDEFVMQIDEYGEPHWGWGDCPMLYIFRNMRTKELHGIVQMF